MTGQERDYDEVLSRVLHSTTDHIEPVGDGLTKIQARLAEPWLKRQWWLLRSEFTTIGWVLAVRCQSWFNTIRSGSAKGAHAGGVTARKASASAASHGGRLRSLPIVGGIATWLSQGKWRRTARFGAREARDLRRQTSRLEKELEGLHAAPPRVRLPTD